MSANYHDRSSKGIDFQQAFEILSSRAAESEAAHSSSPSGRRNENACPCHSHSAAVPPGTLRNLGQVIDLNVDGAAATSPANEEPTATEAYQQEALRHQVEPERTRAERQEKLEQELRSMSTAELLRAVLAAQQQRVAAYRAYNQGLESVLATRNLSLYPALCADATASFSVVSDTIHAVRKAMVGASGGLLHHAAVVGRLQSHESRKLQITAAWHLEQIRWQAADPSDARGANLLRQGVESLRKQLDECADEISEVVQELQCALLDEEEDEERQG